MALENEGQLESEIEADFGSLIGKAMAAKRQLAYIRCLAQIQEIKLVILKDKFLLFINKL